MMRTTYQERRALGCRVQLALVMDEDDQAGVEDLMRTLWLEILYFEKRCSRFLPDSELSQFNRQAGTKQPVSAELADILAAAADMAVRTDGVYNPFILPALQKAGYVGSLEPGRADDSIDDFSARSVASAGQLELGDGWARIPYNTAIDLGGCGKGYIGDRLADMVAGMDDLAGYWFSIGGDTVLGGSDESGAPWTLYLQPDPKVDDRIGEIVVPGDGGPWAVATSSTRYRKGKHSGGAWHHIIDPRSGKAADTDLELAIIHGHSLLLADVLATSVLIVGRKAAPGLVASNDGIRAAAWQGDASDPLELWGDGITTY